MFKFKSGFTLAEVLITLGIISIVAALTMPALITNYQKHVVETRLKKFASVFRQSVKMKGASAGDFGNNGNSGDKGLDYSMLTDANNPELTLNFFNENYAPYLKTIKVEKLSKGIATAFPDGSGLYMRKSTVSGANLQTDGNFYFVFCINYKDCANIDETISPYSAADGVKKFTFYSNGETQASNVLTWDNTDGLSVRELFLRRCTKGNELYINGDYAYCAALIEHDGWEIKDDYPW